MHPTSARPARRAVACSKGRHHQSSTVLPGRLVRGGGSGVAGAAPPVCRPIASVHTLPGSSAGAACSCPSPATVSFGSLCFFAALGQSRSAAGSVLE
jgi:hypothetical protein